MDDIDISAGNGKNIWIGDGGAYETFNLGVADRKGGAMVDFTLDEMKKMKFVLNELIKEYEGESIGNDKEEQVWW